MILDRDRKQAVEDALRLLAARADFVGYADTGLDMVEPICNAIKDRRTSSCACSSSLYPAICENVIYGLRQHALAEVKWLVHAFRTQVVYLPDIVLRTGKVLVRFEAFRTRSLARQSELVKGSVGISRLVRLVKKRQKGALPHGSQSARVTA